MSTAAATARPLRAPKREPVRRHLEVVPTRAQRRARPKLAHIVVVLGGIVVVLLGQLALSLALADGAYTISGLQTEQRDLQRQQAALEEQLEVLSSTQNLIANAEQLGMVASGNPVFLDLASGAVSGTASAPGGSLTGSAGNQVGNSLLDGSTLIDLAALEAAQAAEAADAAAQTGESTMSGTIQDGAAQGGTDQGGTGQTGAPATPGQGAGGTLPSPTTR